MKALNGDSALWAKEIIAAGLLAYDKVAQNYAGLYSVGDEVTMADVVLAPAVDGALRWGVDVESLPAVSRVYNRIKDLEAFQKGDWRHQEDTPEEFRKSG